MSANNGTEKSARSKDLIVNPEKDTRWDDYLVLEPITREAIEWLTDVRVWDGDPPKNFVDRLPAIDEVISEAVTKAFEAALAEVQMLCQALLSSPNDENYPTKYLPKD